MNSNNKKAINYKVSHKKNIIKSKSLKKKINNKKTYQKGGSKKTSKKKSSKKKYNRKKSLKKNKKSSKLIKKNYSSVGGSKKKKINKKSINKKKSNKKANKKSINKKGGNAFSGIVQALQSFEYQEDENKNKSFNNKICSPHLSNQKTEYTCFSHDSLKKIAKAYNKNYEKKNFNINNKESLWKDIRSSLQQQCGDNEVCWKNQNFVQQLNDEEIEEYTFKPKIPKKKYDWLKTSDINKVLVQYQKKHKDFLFLGTVPIDFDELFKEFKKININELINNGIDKIGVVFNLDPHWKGGSHWVCLFAKLPYSIEYFDSYGDKNDNNGKPPKEIQKFMDRLSNQISKVGGGNQEIQKYNKIRHQYANSECGVYCLNYIIERLSGRSFEDITGNINKDHVMNQNRKIYFRE
jgi:hypothetical protein